METIITDDLVKFLTQEMDGKRESVTPNPTDEEAGMIAEAEWAIYTTKQLIADNQALRKRAEERAERQTGDGVDRAAGCGTERR